MKRYRLDELLEIPDNWPISPGMHIDDSIEELAEFPKNTLFYEIDRSNACTLFSVDKRDYNLNFSDKFFYIAIWNSFLNDALENNLVKDFVSKNGVPIFPWGYFMLSDNGFRSAILSMLTTSEHHLLNVESVKHHIVSGNYDTAVREISVKLEDRIREVCGATSRQYGMNLIDQLINNAPLKEEILPHHLQYYRIKFRKFFSLVRNKFAHKINNPDMALTISIMYRCSHLFDVIDENLGYQPLLNAKRKWLTNKD